jgi:hypothetical protein
MTEPSAMPRTWRRTDDPAGCFDAVRIDDRIVSETARAAALVTVCRVRGATTRLASTGDQPVTSGAGRLETRETRRRSPTTR